MYWWVIFPHSMRILKNRFLEHPLRITTKSMDLDPTFMELAVAAPECGGIGVFGTPSTPWS